MHDEVMQVGEDKGKSAACMGYETTRGRSRSAGDIAGTAKILVVAASFKKKLTVVSQCASSYVRYCCSGFYQEFMGWESTCGRSS
jgi:hypothetical protein